MDQPQLRQHVTILGWLHIGRPSSRSSWELSSSCSSAASAWWPTTGRPGPSWGSSAPAWPSSSSSSASPASSPATASSSGAPGAGSVLAFVVAALHIFNIPLGTALGIYTFVVLADPGAEAYFQPAAS